jgi:hypothetical protein
MPAWEIGRRRIWRVIDLGCGSTNTEELSEVYTVAWHDGDTPLVVRPGTLTYMFWAVEGMR